MVKKDSPPAERRWGSFVPVLDPVAKGHPADRGVGSDAPIDSRHGLATLCPSAERRWDSGVEAKIVKVSFRIIFLVSILFLPFLFPFLLSSFPLLACSCFASFLSSVSALSAFSAVFPLYLRFSSGFPSVFARNG